MESDAHTRLGLGTGGVKWPCPRYLVDVSFMRSSGMLDYELCLKCIECDLDVAREANCTLTCSRSSYFSADQSYSAENSLDLCKCLSSSYRPQNSFSLHFNL